jgi:hypothetical protein
MRKEFRPDAYDRKYLHMHNTIIKYFTILMIKEP